MAAIRKPIKVVTEGTKHVARFRHPLRKDKKGKPGKFVRVDLGSDATFRANLSQLNRIILCADNWNDPPGDISPYVRELWLGMNDTLKIGAGGALKGDKALSKTLDNKDDTIVTMQAEIDRLTSELDRLKRQTEQDARKIRALEGENYAEKSTVTLQEAKNLFMASYTKKDTEHTRNVGWDLDRFVNKFGPSTKMNELEGRENEINAWLHSLKNKKGKHIGDSRLSSIAVYVLKLLRINSVKYDKSKIDLPDKASIESEQPLGDIVALTADEASRIIEKLPPMFADVLKIQVRVGLRPDEFLTLCRKNFESAPDYSVLKLSRLEHLTIKNKKGRTVPIPADIRPILKARAEANEILFPEPIGRGGKAKGRPDGVSPWRDPKAFDRRFKKALVAAALAANVKKPMDCRIGRRTCASLLGNAGMTADRIAKLLGNSPRMINEHYWDNDLMNMNLTATDIFKVQVA